MLDRIWYILGFNRLKRIERKDTMYDYTVLRSVMTRTMQPVPAISVNHLAN